MFTNYRGFSIGSTRDSVKEKPGKPKIEDDDGFYFMLSTEEQVQIRLDESKNVSIISITFAVKNENTPKYGEFFGKEVPVAARPDGSIYNLIRYPEAGFWVAYSRTSADDPTVTVTIQKL